MASTIPKQSLLDRIRGSWRILLKEVAAFGVVGALAFVIDITIFNLLFHHGTGPLVAKVTATSVATVFSYVGNTHWSFSHRARHSIGRETSFFFGINAIALVAAGILFLIFEYPLGYKHDVVVMNLVNLVTIAMGTIFRFWAYKRFVFLHPDRVHSPDVDLDEELAE